MIISRLSGGMGNQMFQYALGRSLAIKNNTTLKLDTSEFLEKRLLPQKITFRTYDLDMFAIKGNVLKQQEIPVWYRPVKLGKFGFYINTFRKKLFYKKGREKNFHYDSSIWLLGPKVYLVGYWQSYKYFEKYAEQIKKDFTIKHPLPSHIETVKQKIVSEESVCIHIRRGDYVGNSFHEVVNNDYYTRALELLSQKVPIEHLYVFSDDITWCRDNLSFSFPVIFVGEEYAGERAIGHFALMRSCKHFIIPNSSFAWWAAWLGNNSDKVIIAPKQWFADETINTTDLIPDEWIRI